MKIRNLLISTVMIAGGFCFFYLSYSDFNSLPSPNGTMANTHAFSMAMLYITFGIFGIGLGALIGLNIIEPYYATKSGSRERAKTSLVAGLFAIPFEAVMSLMVFGLSDSKRTQLIWGACLVMLFLDLLRAIWRLRKK